MERELLKRSQRLLLWLGFVPAVLSITAYVISSRHVDSVHTGRAISDLIDSVEGLLAVARDAETGQRGYLLTGNPQYLDPYRAAASELQSKLSSFETLSRDQGVPAAEYSGFRPLLEDKMSELRETIELRQSRGLAAALEVVETGRGKREMDQLRRRAHVFIDREEGKFASSLAQEDNRQSVLNVVLALGVLLSFYLVFFAYRFGTLYGRERDEMDARILELVEQRTAELSERTKELEVRSAELRRSNADLLHFAYVASHDLQEPLRTVASYVGLLARRYRGQLDENADKYIRFAVDGANRMQTLIADLLAYSRVGTQPAEQTVVDLNSVLQVASANLQVALAESGAQIAVASLPAVVGDDKRLTQVFQNLLANSIKFRKPDLTPHIDIRAKRDGDLWIISITDNGIGFDPRFVDRIFQVFQRLHSIGSYPGNGIGLALCKRIIEQQGGSLWADSIPGEGSTFFFSLPASR